MPGNHSAKMKRCLNEVDTEGGKYNKYAVCNASVGKDDNMEKKDKDPVPGLKHTQRILYRRRLGKKDEDVAKQIVKELGAVKDAIAKQKKSGIKINLSRVRRKV